MTDIFSDENTVLYAADLDTIHRGLRNKFPESCHFLPFSLIQPLDMVASKYGHVFKYIGTETEYPDRIGVPCPPLAQVGFEHVYFKASLVCTKCYNIFKIHAQQRNKFREHALLGIVHPHPVTGEEQVAWRDMWQEKNLWPQCDPVPEGTPNLYAMATEVIHGITNWQMRREYKLPTDDILNNPDPLLGAIIESLKTALVPWEVES